MKRAGTPATSQLSGTSFVTTAPGATNVPVPATTPHRIVAFYRGPLSYNPKRAEIVSDVCYLRAPGEQRLREHDARADVNVVPDDDAIADETMVGDHASGPSRALVDAY